MIPILVLYTLVLVFIDQHITFKRIEEYGVNIELNPVVRECAVHLGAFGGSILGVIGFNLVLLGFLSLLKLKSALLFLAGFKSCFALMQLKSFKS